MPSPAKLTRSRPNTATFRRPLSIPLLKETRQLLAGLLFGSGEPGLAGVHYLRTSMSAATKQKNTTEMMPLRVKKAAFIRRMSLGEMMECS
jgi:hypothetical protein